MNYQFIHCRHLYSTSSSGAINVPTLFMLMLNLSNGPCDGYNIFIARQTTVFDANIAHQRQSEIDQSINNRGG